MRFLFVVIYTAFALGANAAAAQTVIDPAALSALREGDMRKLAFHPEPRAVPQTAFADPAGGEHRLGDWRGKVVLVNFWATWCPPCRAEMPGLDRLQTDYGGADFAVLTIATGRNALPAIERFYAETGIAALPILLDGKSALAREMGVFGLPVTVLLDTEGREIARMTGEADWAGTSARAIVEALIAR